LDRHLSVTGFEFPIIFVTGSVEETHRRQAIDFCCVAYLNKRFPAQQLIDTITKALNARERLAT
jgi:CheY-like chemotaxis protein